MTSFLKFDRSINSTTAPTDLQYPGDLFSTAVPQPYIYFIVRDSVWKSAIIKAHLWLYMPPDIQVSYGTVWEDINMLVYQYRDMGGDLASLINEYSSGSGKLPSLDTLKSIGSTVLAKTGKGVVNAIDFGVGSNFGEQFEKLAGRTVNPHSALLFKGVEFREFTFSFHLMARNKEESDNIRDLIKEFKKGAHPAVDASIAEGGWGSHYWQYPDNFDIYLYTPAPQLSATGYMFNILNCALIDISVDYGGSGIPSFFLDTGAPVDIRLKLHFKEHSVLTKELIEAGH